MSFHSRALRGFLSRATAYRSVPSRGGGPQGGFFGEGTKSGPNGYLFGETPPPPGQSRKWESWEAPLYVTGLLTFLILGIGLPSRPDSRLETWAYQEALRREAEAPSK
mmetsp:Transcript_31328/g.74453  ORF Transcript_31328/g.74453 Transcript_31328/m.74453 type:complete len:108 (-) Transcript_31328:303-626(-)